MLALAFVVRLRRHPEAWADDRRHPVRHPFVAALPVSLLLQAMLRGLRDGSLMAPETVASIQAVPPAA